MTTKLSTFRGFLSGKNTVCSKLPSGIYFNKKINDFTTETVSLTATRREITAAGFEIPNEVLIGATSFDDVKRMYSSESVLTIYLERYISDKSLEDEDEDEDEDEEVATNRSLFSVEAYMNFRSESEILAFEQHLSGVTERYCAEIDTKSSLRSNRFTYSSAHVERLIEAYRPYTDNVREHRTMTRYNSKFVVPNLVIRLEKTRDKSVRNTVMDMLHYYGLTASTDDLNEIVVRDFCLNGELLMFLTSIVQSVSIRIDVYTSTRYVVMYEFIKWLEAKKDYE